MGDDAHRTTIELEAGLVEIRKAPADAGVLEMIVRRPEPGKREVLEAGQIDADEGLVGDRWSRQPDPHPETQVTLMGARVVSLLAGERERWQLAGDQLYVDFDISENNLPVGTRLVVGEAILEVTAAPHTGCSQFVEWFGEDAMRFVNGTEGMKLRLRGVNTKVIRPGAVRVGDAVRKSSDGC